MRSLWLILLVALLVSGCPKRVPEPTPEPAPAPSPTPTPKPPPPVPPPAPRPPTEQEKAAAQERAIQAVELLQDGKDTEGQAAVRAALKFDPHNVLALLMLRQLTEDSVVMLGKEYFLYKVLPGDNLSKIAERFLGDKYLFYALARYNNISVPRQLQAGQIIKVPGKAPKNPAPIPAPPPPPQPPPPPPSSEACDKAFQFYQLSEQQRAAGKEILGTLDKAHEWYRECAKLASQSTEARTKLVQMKRPLADAYYREGLKGFHNQQLDLAIQLFQRSLEIDPKHPGAADYLRRAIVLREQCMRTGVCS